jgi:hypothetical protein
LVLVVVSAAWLTQGIWTQAIADSLVCDEHIGPVDAILVDNLDQNYLLFERAASLRDRGLNARVLVPSFHSPHADTSAVEEGILDLMIRTARLKDVEMVHVDQVEPISLNVALQMRELLTKEHIRSLMVVTTGFRAARALLAYQAALRPVGISVSCVPVFGTIDQDTWRDTWHGIQEVGLQFLKLTYYRFYVLPFHLRNTTR